MKLPLPPEKLKAWGSRGARQIWSLDSRQMQCGCHGRRSKKKKAAFEVNAENQETSTNKDRRFIRKQRELIVVWPRKGTIRKQANNLQIP